IDGIAVTSSSLLVASSRRAVSELAHHTLDGTPLGTVELPEVCSLAGVAGSRADDVAVLALTSFTRPSTLFRWNPDRSLVPWSDLPGGPDPNQFVVEQVDYPSTDGTAIP